MQQQERLRVDFINYLRAVNKTGILSYQMDKYGCKPRSEIG